MEQSLHKKSNFPKYEQKDVNIVQAIYACTYSITQ